MDTKNSLRQQMIASLSRLIDWSAIQVLTIRTPRDNGQSPRLEEALQFLKGPDFIPAESQPARVEFNGPLHFRFPTPRPGDFAENNVVYGRLYRCAERWQERPVIVLLHGGMDFPNHRFLFPLIARGCNRAGFNAATMELPYHFQRHVRQLDGGIHLRLAELMAQGVAEICALTGWFFGEGFPAVALWGVSLGAWLAGLVSCRDARLASVVMTASPARLNNLLSQAEQVIGRRRREVRFPRREAYDALDTTPLNLNLSQPIILRENILLIEGMYDLCVSSGPIELWQTWGRPEIWRLPHGHIGIGSQLIPGLRGRVLRWLAPRLNVPRSFTDTK